MLRGRAHAAVLLLTILAFAARLEAQNVVRGQLPEGAFEIDPNKKSSWNKKAMDSNERAISLPRFENRNLGRWEHDYPKYYASALSAKKYQAQDVQMPKVQAPQVAVAAIEPKKAAPKVQPKDAGTGQLIANQKWSGKTGKAPKIETASVAAPRFIAQVPIRQLGQQELKEKLNQFSGSGR